jgi:predicted nucleic acid-binding protein
VHGLRAYDAIQLAAARAARGAADGCTTFAAFDTTLRAAAAVEGFALLPADPVTAR